MRACISSLMVWVLRGLGGFVVALMNLFVFLVFWKCFEHKGFAFFVLVLAKTVVVLRGDIYSLVFSPRACKGDALLVWSDFPRAWGPNALICCELENFGFCLFLSPFAEAPRWTQIFKIELGILEMVTGDAVVVWPQRHRMKAVVVVCMSLEYEKRPLMDSNHRPTA